MPAPALTTPGVTGWHELMAVDWSQAIAFYTALFGWTKADAVDMGPMGTYQLFAAAGQPIGGMFNKPAAMPVPFWLYYVRVDAIDTAAERVSRAGGRILNGPIHKAPCSLC